MLTTQRRWWRLLQVLSLAVLLSVVGCAGLQQAMLQTPAPLLSPPAATVPPVVTSTVAEPPASPTSVPTVVPTARPAPTPTVTTGPTASITPALEQTTPSPVTVTAGACPEAHTAPIEASTDLSPAGRAIAPPLAAFNQYRLDLELDPASATLTGTQTLVFTNRTGQPLPDLLFHLYPNLGGSDPQLMNFAGRLDVRCVAVDGARIAPTLEDGNWLLRVPFAAPLANGASARVTIGFVSSSPRNGGESVYGAFNETQDLWTLASFYPTLTIRVGDGWDRLRPNGWSDFVNSDMALYHVQARFPAGQTLISTGLAAQNCSAAGCTATATAGPQRDFTMALVRGWQQDRRMVGDVSVVSSFPPQWRAAGERVLALAVDSLSRYSKAFGAYPYAEFDILPIPASGFAGVEYPGLSMISDSYYSRAGAPSLDLQDVVVHEVAHQWWYDVVGNDVLREAWLDEGITSYTGEYLYTEWSGTGQKPLTQARKTQLERLNLDKTPIDQPVQQYDSERAYVAVIYARAPLFLDAMRRELGDETFFKFLQAYYQRFGFKQATTQGFKKLAEEVAGRKLDPLWARWFTQKPS